MDESFMPDDLTPQPDVKFRGIVVNDTGSRKIEYIKLLRQTTQCDLTTAKELAERPTPHLLAICDQQAARQFQSMAAAVGATCELVDYEDEMTPLIDGDQMFDPTGGSKAGCATAMLLLATTAAGMVYGLVLLMQKF